MAQGHGSLAYVWLVHGPLHPAAFTLIQGGWLSGDNVLLESPLFRSPPSRPPVDVLHELRPDLTRNKQTEKAFD